MGVDTHSNLKKIIDKITTVNFDTLLISGDLAHNGTPGSYQTLKEILSPLQNNIVVMPGNHDNAENLSQLFGKNLAPNFSLGDWEIITADSVQVAQTSGFLTQNTLLNLDLSLKNTKAKYNVVVLHHPPVPMQSNWDDTLSLKNCDEFFSVIDKYPKIKAILWGHAHQATDFKRGKLKLISCPSTALQFDNEKRIGFNHYKLYDNGNLEFDTQWL
jgi:Icc protein|nr:metallophosphoesterase [uncultured Candidatus Thioglobus sp.]